MITTASSLDRDRLRGGTWGLNLASVVDVPHR
jgi:hypothetical protein